MSLEVAQFLCSYDGLRYVLNAFAAAAVIYALGSLFR